MSDWNATMSVTATTQHASKRLHLLLAILVFIRQPQRFKVEIGLHAYAASQEQAAQSMLIPVSPRSEHYGDSLQRSGKPRLPDS